MDDGLTPPDYMPRVAVSEVEGALRLVDPSLAVAALRTNPEQPMRDLSFFGLLFESMVVVMARISSGMGRTSMAA